MKTYTSVQAIDDQPIGCFEHHGEMRTWHGDHPILEAICVSEFFIAAMNCEELVIESPMPIHGEIEV